MRLTKLILPIAIALCLSGCASHSNSTSAQNTPSASTPSAVKSVDLGSDCSDWFEGNPTLLSEFQVSQVVLHPDSYSICGMRQGLADGKAVMMDAGSFLPTGNMCQENLDSLVHHYAHRPSTTTKGINASDTALVFDANKELLGAINISGNGGDITDKGCSGTPETSHYSQVSDQ